jgi:hypothetical protein
MLFQSYSNGGLAFNTYNTAIGFQALLNNNPATTGDGHNNTAVGVNALYGNTTGIENAGMGRNTLVNTTVSDGNTAIGVFAGDSYNNGDENTFLGHYADATAASYTNATAIGARATVGASNSIVLGSIAGVNGATSSVKVGIGVQAPSAELEVNGYTKLGTDAPKIKMKKLTGVCPATEGSTVALAHGVTSTKILSCQVLVEYSAGSFVPNSYTLNAEYEFTYYITGTNVVVWLAAGNSGNLVNDDVVVLVTYEE